MTASRNGRMRGIVKRYGPGDYGFIRTDEGADVFVGAGALRRSGICGLCEGDRVEFTVAPSQRGTQAVEIRRVAPRIKENPPVCQDQRVDS